MGACQECRKSKVKCEAADGTTEKCKRCVRLSLPCTPHVSRQGQGQKRKRKSSPGENRECTIEADVVEQTSKFGSNHYGLHFVIRHWVSIAMTRRSFSLMDRASALACRCGISMDQVFCGLNEFPLSATSVDGNRAMSFLPNIILKPSSEQQVGGAELALTEVPQDLLQAIDCLSSAARLPETRWITIREMKCGVSRYYVSPAFQNDIATWDVVQSTWKENKMEVNDLWLPKEEKPKFSRGFNQQLAIYKDPYLEPKPTSIKGTKIRLKDGQEMQVDCCLCLIISSLDQAFLSIEYYTREPQETSSKQPETELFQDMAFLDSMMDELEATGELDALMKDFEF